MTENEQTIQFRPPIESDAEILFPLIYGTSVPDTLAWEGPQSLEEYQRALRTRGAQVVAGLLHFFTIVECASGNPIGSCDVRPAEDGSMAMVGLWIGEPYQGKGLGTSVIDKLVEYAFDKLDVGRVEADVFVGNLRSRKAFERNGFALLEIIPAALIKRGEPVDEWRMRLMRDQWEEQMN